MLLADGRHTLLFASGQKLRELGEIFEKIQGVLCFLSHPLHPLIVQHAHIRYIVLIVICGPVQTWSFAFVIF
jgi:hypothetical protein